MAAIVGPRYPAPDISGLPTAGDYFSGSSYGAFVSGPGGTLSGLYDGKRIRKAVNRKTVDYNSAIIRHLQDRVWQRDYRDHPVIQPDEAYFNELYPPTHMPHNPGNAIATRFVRTASNKHKFPVFALAWTPEGRRLVTSNSSGEFTLWNGLTFNFETILQAHDCAIRSIIWSHNDQWMLSADNNGFVKYWQSNMNTVKMFQAHKDPVRGVSFCPTDAKFTTCSDDGTVRIWDFNRCHEEQVLRGHGADVKCVDWHPQKGLVVSGSKDSQQPVKFWDPKSGEALCTLHGHKNTVTATTFNRNGNWLLTSSRDHLIKLWDIRTMREMETFRGHKKEVSSLAWHPIHEDLFASGGYDGSILYWMSNCGKEVGGLEGAHEGPVWDLAWHPLGHILVSGSNDHTSKFWTRNRPGDTMADRNNQVMASVDDSIDNDFTGDDFIPGMGEIVKGVSIPSNLISVGPTQEFGPGSGEASMRAAARRDVRRPPIAMGKSGYQSISQGLGGTALKPVTGLQASVSLPNAGMSYPPSMPGFPNMHLSAPVQQVQQMQKAQSTQPQPSQSSAQQQQPQKQLSQGQPTVTTPSFPIPPPGMPMPPGPVPIEILQQMQLLQGLQRSGQAPLQGQQPPQLPMPMQAGQRPLASMLPPSQPVPEGQQVPSHLPPQLQKTQLNEKQAPPPHTQEQNRPQEQRSISQKEPSDPLLTNVNRAPGSSAPFPHPSSNQGSHLTTDFSSSAPNAPRQSPWPAPDRQFHSGSQQTPNNQNQQTTHPMHLGPRQDAAGPPMSGEKRPWPDTGSLMDAKRRPEQNISPAGTPAGRGNPDQPWSPLGPRAPPGQHFNIWPDTHRGPGGFPGERDHNRPPPDSSHGSFPSSAPTGDPRRDPRSQQTPFPPSQGMDRQPIAKGQQDRDRMGHMQRDHHQHGPQRGMDHPGGPDRGGWEGQRQWEAGSPPFSGPRGPLPPSHGGPGFGSHPMDGPRLRMDRPGPHMGGPRHRMDGPPHMGGPPPHMDDGPHPNVDGPHHGGRPPMDGPRRRGGNNRDGQWFDEHPGAGRGGPHGHGGRRGRR